MGDVIHALPVVSDLLAARPGIEIDWLVEESFADLPRLHPGVDRTLTVAVRRWRRTPLSAAVRAEVRDLAARLRERRYDLALDLQGLVKSAWLARLTGAPIAGFAWGSAREMKPILRKLDGSLSVTTGEAPARHRMPSRYSRPIRRKSNPARAATMRGSHSPRQCSPLARRNAAVKS